MVLKNVAKSCLNELRTVAIMFSQQHKHPCIKFKQMEKKMGKLTYQIMSFIIKKFT